MESKTDALISQMTLEEKAAFLAGADMWHTVPLERLGIPAIQVSDGPNGVRGSDDQLSGTSLCFPVGVAMGATWNPELIEAVGGALAAQVRAKGAHVLLAPTVNIQRTPLAGRNFECFAEDPCLSGTLAAAYVGGLQASGVGACIKHFTANDQEYQRFSISAEVAERPLHEIYLEPFRIAKEVVNPWSIMSAYNRLNGVYAGENRWLLHDLLKERWGYDGVVMSDWYGTYSEAVVGGGLDLEMPGPARWMTVERVVAAVTEGRVDEAEVDDKVRRLLRLVERVTGRSTPIPTPDADLPRTVAAESIVLLKNENNLLPLDPEQTQTIAVIGENGKWAQIMGGGSSQVNPEYAISPLDGIRRRAGSGVDVPYAVGTPIHKLPPLLDDTWLSTADGQPGLTLHYFHNLELAGEPAHSDVVGKTELSWFGTVNPFVDPSCFSLRLQGNITPAESGSYRFHLKYIGRARLFIDGALTVDGWTARDAEAVLDLEAGRAYTMRLEYATDPESGWRTVRLGCAPVLPADPIDEAVALAARADVAVVVAGLSAEWESEGFDRPDMTLPGAQDELIARIAAANANTVVVLNAGSPVEMPWVDRVPVVLQQWYGGQDAGNGLADVLFGDVNPSGRLPVTFPRRLEDNPAHINYPGENGRVHYGEGLFVGYRYYDVKEIEPLFPFGHGLSYTRFTYGNLRLNGDTFGPGDEILVTVDVTNGGGAAGQEVVQLYVHDEAARLARPVQELKAFAKIALAPGETKAVALRLDQQSLAYYDPARDGWVTEPGIFEIRVGASSRDIRLTGRLTWEDDHFEPVVEITDPRQLSTVET